ncbi:hypothetical protein Hrd1104_08895 [Halorhabdus sp. CBA1104]|uniref:hypothetical protein n=1 Tax=Halorhabdus sp. CBA1104 TaxID=1380432 RepID=UPI0012B414B6|nr:hypothetical protein [Halorhabdus sp. CBA1104]QGN07411.1 hypothetical protein Hrd1104_08895 [Halorhabdus sp. CBA1104]
MNNDPFDAGDVFWAPDPYNAGENPRPWLVLTAEGIPYGGEEYLCAGLTLSDLPENIEITDDDWRTGNHPERTSYCSPWVLATVKHDAVANPQGTVTTDFRERVIGRSVDYLTADLDVSLR